MVIGSGVIHCCREMELIVQNNNGSGSHSGSNVTRVNMGQTSGTWSGHAYSFAGLKDREQLTRSDVQKDIIVYQKLLIGQRYI